MFQEKEQRDDIVTDVLGEIIDESLNVILQRHIDRIAVHKAVKDVTQILSDSLKLYFISHDQGKTVKVIRVQKDIKSIAEFTNQDRLSMIDSRVALTQSIFEMIVGKSRIRHITTPDFGRIYVFIYRSL